jgi:microcystin-dependent protein
MADQYVGEIRIFPGNFAPAHWALCNGQLLPIAQNTALFSLLGTFYGGDGKSTFSLPNLQGNVPIGFGSGPGLSQRSLGEASGVSTVTLLPTEMPSHTHVPNCTTSGGGNASPGGNIWSKPPGKTVPAEYSASAPNSLMTAGAIATTGSGLPHNNLQPFLGLNFIIALQGVFPPRA